MPEFAIARLEEFNELQIEFDGACEPKNPGGVATAGWVIREKEKQSVVAKGCMVVADGGKMATNNVAEYWALGLALRCLRSWGWRGSLVIYGDSKLVINQVGGEWRCNKPHLQRLRDRIRQRIEEIAGDNFLLQWIPREKNSVADQLSKEAYEEHCRSKGAPVKYFRRKSCL